MKKQFRLQCLIFRYDGKRKKGKCRKRKNESEDEEVRVRVRVKEIPNFMDYHF
jgi:hypothetical protein